MASDYRTQRRIEFADTDTAGIVHFSNFFRFMESVEHEFFRSLGHTLHTQVDGQMFGFARVHADCDYAAPLRYAELVEIELRVAEIRASTLSYAFRFLREADGSAVATGKLTVCCVTGDPETERMKAVAIPAEILALIEVAPPV